MQKVVDAIVQSRVVRTLVLLVVIIPISFYLGTSRIRRGILYYLGVFAPSFVVAIAIGLWTWNVTQALVYLFW